MFPMLHALRSASLLAIGLLAACPGNGGGGDGPDAGVPGDSASDGETPDGPTLGRVDVVVAGWPAPSFVPTAAANVPVVFYKPDGTFSSMVRTDALGHASGMIERGSLVLVVNGSANRADVHVDGAIASPGDTLRFGPDPMPRQMIGTLNVSWPARPITGYTTYYTLVTPCGGAETTSTSMSIPLYDGCAGSSFDVVVTSRRSSQETTGILARRAVVPAATVNVNLADNGGAWSVGAFTNIAMQSSPNASEPMPSGSCTGRQFLGTLAFNGTSATQFSDNCQMRLLPGTETTWQIEAGYERSDDRNFNVTLRRTFMHDNVGTFDGSGALPWITSFTFSSATRTATWASAAAAPLDSSSLRIEVTGTRYLIWRVYAPGGLPASFVLPQLPTELAMWEFSAADTMRAALQNTDVVGATTDQVLQHNLYYDDATFASNTVRGAMARTP